MLGYGVLASAARPSCAMHSTATNAKVPTVIGVTILRFIDFPLRIGFQYTLEHMMPQPAWIIAEKLIPSIQELPLLFDHYGLYLPEFLELYIVPKVKIPILTSQSARRYDGVPAFSFGE